jgi:hypothetical protein
MDETEQATLFRTAAFVSMSELGLNAGTMVLLLLLLQGVKAK